MKMKFPKINIKAFLMGRGMFITLALIFLAAATMFGIYHLIFVFGELNKGLGSGEESAPIPGYNLEGFQNIGLIDE